MGTLDQAREPRGVPGGGRWASDGHARADGDLNDRLFNSPAPVPTWATIDKRMQMIADGEPVAGAAWRSPTDPNSTAGIDQWWASHFITAEHAGDAGDYPKMADDFGSTTGGRSLEGNRRVHRMKYTGAGVSLRMPSATKIKQFQHEMAAGGHNTIEVPVEVSNADGSHGGTGAVRLTREGDRWKATPVGFGGDHARTGEVVEAVLEARRPTTALDDVARQGGFDQRARERARQQGAPPAAVRSSFIGSMAYDQASGTAFVRMKSGRMYGYECAKDTYQQVMGAESPGRAYNQFIKNAQPRRTTVEACDTCGAFTFGGGHQCDVQHAPRQRRADPTSRKFTAAARSLVSRLRPAGR